VAVTGTRMLTMAKYFFGSPRHLNPQFVCTSRRDTPDVWPALPLIILCHGGYSTGSADNITAVLERIDRVCQIHLWSVESFGFGNIFWRQCNRRLDLVRSCQHGARHGVLPAEYMVSRSYGFCPGSLRNNRSCTKSGVSNCQCDVQGDRDVVCTERVR
jgi:hypothetical protein